MTAQSALMEDEIFGPVLPVLRFRERAERRRRSSARPAAVVLYVFARKRRVISEVLSNTTSSGAVVNNVLLHWANPHLPFGGVRPAASAATTSFGFRAFSHERSLVSQRWPAMTRMLFPPYGAVRSRLLSNVLKALE